MSRTCHDCKHCQSWYISPTREEPGEDGWECTFPWPEGWEPEDKEYDELEAETCIHFERTETPPEEPYQPKSTLDLYSWAYNLIMVQEF